jgi:magnesium chelatase subunit D
MKPAHRPDVLTPWELALKAAAIFAVAPHSLGGVRLRGSAGPVRDAWLDSMRSILPRSTPVLRLPSGTGDSRLLGGLDLAATLRAGHPVAERGLLAEADGGVVLMPMAERTSAGTSARLSAAMDRGTVATERDGITLLSPSRFGIVAFDEGLDAEEQPPLALLERLALVVDIRALTHRDSVTGAQEKLESIVAARKLLALVQTDDAIMIALCSASLAMGIPSLRTSLQALQVAQILAALAGRTEVAQTDAALAAILVLAPRATQLPASLEEPQEQQDTCDAQRENEQQENLQDTSQPDNSISPETTQPLEDVVIDAAVAAIPAGLLALMKARGMHSAARVAGRAGQTQASASRGRVIGSKAGDIRSGARLDVVETLRAAAPWQMLRRKERLADHRGSGIAVRREDFRVTRYKHRTQTTTIFVVDASGSSALQRLAEAKGAVRLLLADCYVRRDEVAMIAFRGQSADVILPPTRALVRAQRALAALPGGGGTPIATALDAAITLVDLVRRGGRTPTVVVMTDGRANVARNGSGGRAVAQEEARQAARLLLGRQCAAILIDTSAQPQTLAAELAACMGARYLPLPQANAHSVAAAVTQLRGDVVATRLPGAAA